LERSASSDPGCEYIWKRICLNLLTMK
jgi:hypothetical protein